MLFLKCQKTNINQDITNKSEKQSTEEKQSILELIENTYGNIPYFIFSSITYFFILLIIFTSLLGYLSNNFTNIEINKNSIPIILILVLFILITVFLEKVAFLKK